MNEDHWPVQLLDSLDEQAGFIMEPRVIFVQPALWPEWKLESIMWPRDRKERDTTGPSRVAAGTTDTAASAKTKKP